MGKPVLAQRRGAGNGFRTAKRRTLATRLPCLNYAQKRGYMRGIVKEIKHDKGRGAPMAVVQFRHSHRYKKINETWVCPEGVSTGQFVYCGKNAQINVGNVLPLKKLPEGSIICNLEGKEGDRGTLVRASGCFAILIANNEGNKSRVRLPSGRKKTINSDCRAMLGIVGGGGRVDKPLLKAGTNHFRWKAKRKNWPVVRGVARNPVEHPHGGGNHQHIGHPSTVRRDCPPGQKVGLCAARRTGRLTGGGGTGAAQSSRE
eukprot:TRINITY_DN67100_c7_g3_i1.p1 TRINITY_DN67100_c7_g3~~TRINITY_DN67100_c7_g3_i1.p1  ORF type:complete len:270 (+),score=21.76 TRINITY_DN67100_c7_g3_i1:36-812(+)